MRRRREGMVRVVATIIVVALIVGFAVALASISSQ
jgi:hypothetical protein